MTRIGNPNRTRSRPWPLGLLPLVVMLVAVGCADGPSAEADACRELPSDVAGSIRALLPDGWTLDEGSIVQAADIQRTFDNAPSEVIAAWVLDDAGEPFSGGPVLWVIDGGSGRAWETAPKTWYILNQASMDLMPILAEAGAERGRQLRMWPEATDPRIGWSLDHPAVLEALDCVGAS